MLWHELGRTGARPGLREIDERLSFLGIPILGQNHPPLLHSFCRVGTVIAVSR